MTISKSARKANSPRAHAAARPSNALLENYLLETAPAKALEAMRPHLQHVPFSLGHLIYAPMKPIRQVFFPTAGLISVVATMKDGSTIEVGLVSKDGMAGVPLLLGVGRGRSPKAASAPGALPESDSFFLTQEFVAAMLGVRRAGVTLAAGILQKAGLIDYRRGRMRIVDRERLEAAACECDEAGKTDLLQLYSAQGMAPSGGARSSPVKAEGAGHAG